jgi:putative ABC transport system permease protein
MKNWPWSNRNRRRREDELDEEIRAHLSMAAQERTEQGESEKQARAAATREFGNVALVKEVTRDMWGFVWLETLMQDLRYGLRQLRRNPGFMAVAVITLALGIGSSATMFNALEALTFVRPHIENLDRIASLQATNLGAGSNGSMVSVPAYLDVREQNQSFEGLAAFTAGASNLSGIREPARVSCQRVSSNFFRVLGVAPVLGRTFLPEENRSGAESVVVLSYSLWERSFGARGDALGEKVHIDGQPATIIGVMPKDFDFPAPGTDLWLPLALDPAQFPRTNRYLSVVGLLKTQVEAKQAQQEMDAIARRMEKEYPAAESAWGLRVSLVRDEMMKKVALGLAGLLGPSVCVLLIVCANLAGLLLARASTRQMEIAVRTALGAGRARLLRQLVTENLLLSLVGGGLGLALAYWGIRLVRFIIPPTVPRYVTQALHLDLGVLGFAILVSFIAPIGFGLAPALTASKPDLVEALKRAGRKSAFGLRGPSMRDLLVAFEVTLAMVLLTTVSVWGMAMVKLHRVETGFDPRNLMTLDLSPPSSSYATNEELLAFYDRVLENVEEIPGVESAAATSLLPASGGEQFSLGIASREAGAASVAGPPIAAVQQSVSSDYFKVLGIRVLAGRYFSLQDSAAAPPVALVSLATARRLWNGENAVGKRLSLGDSDTPVPWVTIVGVVNDVMSDRRVGPPLPYIYTPYAQHPARDMTLVVRASGRGVIPASTLRCAVQSVDKSLPLDDVKTMEQVLSLDGPRFMVGLVAVFSFLALALAAVGVYGVASFMANARTHEIGIRMALGAKRGNILWLIARESAASTLAGCGLGLLGAIGLSVVLRSQVAGVSYADPLALSLAGIVLMGTAMLALSIPARRATKVDPMVALRYE